MPFFIPLYTMCWIGNHKNLKKTEKDISVFKILHKKCNENTTILLSTYQDFHYVLHKKVTSEVEVENWISADICEISKAIHSYSSELVHAKLVVPNRAYIYYPNDINHIDEWLDDFSTDGSFVRVNGIIPKGSTYAINDRGEYVSDSIILKEIVPLI